MKLNENSKKVLEMITKKGSGQVTEYLKEIVGAKVAYECADEIADELESNELINTVRTSEGHTIAMISPKGREYLKYMAEKD